MGFKIELDQDICIGCCACEATCEETFGMEGDKAFVKKDHIDEMGTEKEAEEGCPVDCIKVTED